MKKPITRNSGIAKCPTGIRGLDEIIFGGLPRGRPTLLCGGTGCGSTYYGLEQHLVAIHKRVEEFQPTAVIMDPLTNLTPIGSAAEITAMLTRLVDFLKRQGITAIFTSLTDAERGQEQTSVGVSSLMDTWLLLRQVENNGDRKRLLYILKSRGMAHSSQVREFLLTDKGIQLHDAAPRGV